MRLARAQPWLLGARVAASPRVAASMPVAASAALAVAYLIWEPVTTDLAAQVYRTELWEREGFTVWNAQWYAGHHTPGYSLLFPPLAALLGPRLVGALAAVAAAFLFERIAREHFGERAWLGALWFGGATATSLVTNRLTFALGVAIALGAILAAQRGRHGVAIGLAALSALASPVAAAFLALAALSWAGAQAAPRLRARAGVRAALDAPGVAISLGLAASAIGPVLLLAAAFPEGGTQPYAPSDWWPILGYAAAVLVLVPREERALRVGAVMYAAASTAAYFIDTPMGSNAERLGMLMGAPLLACALWGRRTVWLLALTPALLLWQLRSPVSDIAKAHDDRASERSYYRPLLDFLATREPLQGRVEVPSSRNKWEAVYVARRFPLARGWERQLDTKYNAVLYRRDLDATLYRRWLDENGVRFVALSDARGRRADYSSKRERRLLVSGLPYLRPVWSSRHWRVFEVEGAAPLVSGAGRLDDLGVESFAVRADRPGTALVRARFTPYWKVVEGRACVERTASGFTRLRIRAPGLVRVHTSFSPGRLWDRGPRCRR
jgi:hypothetical protein